MLCHNHLRGEVYAEQASPALIPILLGPENAQGLQRWCGLRRHGIKHPKSIRSFWETSEDTVLVI
jgi:hypothetical protein